MACMPRPYLRMACGVSELNNMSLLSTVYSQSWPAPDPNKASRGFNGKIPQQSPRTNKVHHSTSGSPQQNHGGSERQGFHSRGIAALQGQHAPRGVSQRLNLIPSRHAGLDKATYKWETWTNYRQDCESDQNDLTLYKITQDTFRKLSEQVGVVNQQMNKYHNTGFKSYYAAGDSRRVPITNPTQLAASLPHQPPSISTATAIDAAIVESGLALQCRPVQRSNRRRPHSSVAFRQKYQQLTQRPHFSTSLIGRQATAEFDQLTPRMIGALSGGNQTNIDASHPGPFDIVSNYAKPEIVDDENGQSDEDSDGGPHVFRVRTPPNFDLPPEDMNIHDHRGKFQYRSSSASKKKQEPYPEALSVPYCYLDLLELSLLKEDWRHAVRAVPIGIEDKLIDRLIEMERLQTASTEWEKGQRTALPKRAMSATQITKGWNSVASVPTERAQSALAKPKQSRNCSPECLQPLCSGNCASKQEPPNGGCSRCKQEYCQGSCTEFGYHLHIRCPREEDEVPPARPKSCKSCTTGRNSSRKSVINSNTTVLGRPKSAFATFSSAHQQVRKPRPVSTVATNVSKEMAKLGLSSAPNMGGDRPPRPKKASSGTIPRPKAHGRDTMLPGKSFTSQRRHSLTDEPMSTSAAKMNPKPMRLKSARLKAKQKRNTQK